MRRALVVDDSRAQRMMLKRLLVAAGFEVAEAGHGLDALDRLGESGPVELMLVDWNMPQMDGLELIKAVRSQLDFERIVVVMVTSENEPTQIARALMAGADEYALKPLTADGLTQKLQLVGMVE